jgi:bile acid:Na+ symporter, BASS family
VLFLAVTLLHVGGFALGWVFAWLFGYGEVIRRTVSIEVGMQNSGLGAVLARENFPLLPSAPTPCAISAVFHSVIGSMLAGLWRLWPASDSLRESARDLGREDGVLAASVGKPEISAEPN